MEDNPLPNEPTASERRTVPQSDSLPSMLELLAHQLALVAKERSGAEKLEVTVQELVASLGMLVASQRDLVTSQRELVISQRQLAEEQRELVVSQLRLSEDRHLAAASGHESAGRRAVGRLDSVAALPAARPAEPAQVGLSERERVEDPDVVLAEEAAPPPRVPATRVEPPWPWTDAQRV